MHIASTSRRPLPARLLSGLGQDFPPFLFGNPLGFAPTSPLRPSEQRRSLSKRSEVSKTDQGAQLSPFYRQPDRVESRRAAPASAPEPDATLN